MHLHHCFRLPVATRQDKREPPRNGGPEDVARLFSNASTSIALYVHEKPHCYILKITTIRIDTGIIKKSRHRTSPRSNLVLVFFTIFFFPGTWNFRPSYSELIHFGWSRIEIYLFELIRNEISRKCSKRAKMFIKKEKRNIVLFWYQQSLLHNVLRFKLNFPSHFFNGSFESHLHNFEHKLKTSYDGSRWWLSEKKKLRNDNASVQPSFTEITFVALISLVPPKPSTGKALCDKFSSST